MISNLSPEQRRQFIMAEWKKGRTFSDIATDLGITRERVGQIVGRKKGAMREAGEMVPFKQAARQLHISLGTVSRWTRAGRFGPSPRATVNITRLTAYVIKLKARRCWSCGRPVNSIRSDAVGCSKHVLTDNYVLSSKRYPYRAWSAARKQHHKQLVERWHAKHAEQEALISRRSRMVYKLTQAGVPREEARKRAREKYPYSWKGEL